VPGSQPVTKDTPGALKDLDEYNVLGEEVYGRAVLRIPYIGYVKIWATDAFWAVVNIFA
jgi:hypothetical protein